MEHRFWDTVVGEKVPFGHIHSIYFVWGKKGMGCNQETHGWKMHLLLSCNVGVQVKDQSESHYWNFILSLSVPLAQNPCSMVLLFTAFWTVGPSRKAQYMSWKAIIWFDEA